MTFALDFDYEDSGRDFVANALVAVGVIIRGRGGHSCTLSDWLFRYFQP